MLYQIVSLFPFQICCLCEQACPSWSCSRAFPAILARGLPYPRSASHAVAQTHIAWHDRSFHILPVTSLHPRHILVASVLEFNTKMAATARALGTYELIENIITCLGHSEDIASARRVCKDWHDVVERSQSIQHAYCVRPSKTFYPYKGTNPFGAPTLIGDPIPLYETTTAIRLHRLIQRRSIRWETKRGDPRVVSFIVSPHLLPDNTWAGRMMTDPPVTRVLVYDQYSLTPTWIIREHGITLGDLVTAAHGLRRPAKCSILRSNEMNAQCVHGWFGVCHIPEPEQEQRREQILKPKHKSKKSKARSTKQKTAGPAKRKRADGVI